MPVAGVLIQSRLGTHRILFRRRRKPELVDEASRLALAGLTFLMISVIGSVYLIFSVVVGTGTAVVVAGAIGLWLLYIWYAQPLLQRRSLPRSSLPRETGGPHR